MNCLIVDDDPLSRKVVEHFVAKTDFLRLVKSCPDAIEAYKVLRNEQIDLVFLDIELPEMSGLEFIKSIERKPYFILITSKKDYAVEAFEQNVLDYLLKPISYPRFLKAVEKSRRDAPPSNDTGEIFIKADSGRLVKISTSKILWIEALADYVIIYTPQQNYTIHTTMKSMEQKLSRNEFIRAHRSFIVRIDKITEIQENMLVINTHLIPIGRLYRNDLMKRLNLI